jgi:glycosyltransferase involved in cell wall biosynthesis
MGESAPEVVPDVLPELTIILPVYNGAAHIADQLDALVDQSWSPRWEVLVVDNGSTDLTRVIVEQYVTRHPELIRVTDAPDAHNLAYVRNVGVRAALGTAVAFCDDDDLVGEAWVSAMGDALRDHALVGSHMEYRRLSSEPALSDRAEFQSNGIESVFGIPVVNGVSGVQRSLWDALGGNDETLHATGEDFDFAMRAHLHRGVEPHFAPDAIYHVRRRSSRKATFRQARRYGRAMAFLYARHARGQVGHRNSSKSAVWAWLWIGLHINEAFDTNRSVRWAWRAGTRLGRLEGSVRHRVVYL